MGSPAGRGRELWRLGGVRGAEPPAWGSLGPTQHPADEIPWARPAVGCRCRCKVTSLQDAVPGLPVTHTCTPESSLITLRFRMGVRDHQADSMMTSSQMGRTPLCWTRWGMVCPHPQCPGDPSAVHSGLSTQLPTHTNHARWGLPVHRHLILMVETPGAWSQASLKWVLCVALESLFLGHSLIRTDCKFGKSHGWGSSSCCACSRAGWLATHSCRGMCGWSLGLLGLEVKVLVIGTPRSLHAASPTADAVLPWKLPLLALLSSSPFLRSAALRVWPTVYLHCDFGNIGTSLVL